MKRALFIGRFQPPHKGHFHVIKQLVEEIEEELVIVVAAAQHSHRLVNPFTAGERISMILEGIKEEKIDRTKILLIPAQDINDHILWPHHIARLVPPFDVVLSNNPLVQELFTAAGYQVKPVGLWKREQMSSTIIRERMINGEEGWRELVPVAVQKVIEKINGVKRLQRLAQTDKQVDSKSYDPHA